MLVETSLVPLAACWMLRAISRVAAPCSSTAAAIAVVTSLISLIVVLMFLIALTADVVTRDHVLAYEHLPNHGNGGMNVLFGDGNVRWVERAEAERMVEELSHGHNPPGVTQLVASAPR